MVAKSSSEFGWLLSLLWPFILGSIGYYVGFVVFEHPHAWQVFPALGIVTGLFVTVLHIANLIHKRRKRLRSEKSGSF
jgi:membrane protein DedA with SNARE-associated domain